MENNQTELLKRVASFLTKHKIPYMITGAWSAIFYGRPRASHDIDFVVEINKKDLEKVLNSFKELSEDFLVQTEMIEEAVNYKSMFNIIHLPSMLKLDFWLLTADEFDKSRFKRRKKVKILDQIMNMASAEDTILQKLRWFNEAKIEKHLIDAAFVYQIQKNNLDFKYLELWVNKLGLKKYYLKLGKIDLKDYF